MRLSRNLRGNPYVELVHWVQQILQAQDSDFRRIVRHFEIDATRLARDITVALDNLPRGATSISDLSANVESAVEPGWVYATLMFGDRSIRSGVLLVGILKTTSLRNALFAIPREFEAVNVDTLTDQFAQITAGSPEDPATEATSGGAFRPESPASRPLNADIFICYRRQDSSHSAGRISTPGGVFPWFIDRLDSWRPRFGGPVTQLRGTS